MTPQQTIKYMILAVAACWNNTELPTDLTGEQVDDLYAEQDCLQDAKNEVRSGEAYTQMPCESSRHYDSKAVAGKAPNGQWVGWTYWTGGGKHGEPDSIDWISNAYFLDCKEEEVKAIKRTFTKVEVAA